MCPEPLGIILQGSTWADMGREPRCWPRGILAAGRPPCPETSVMPWSCGHCRGQLCPAVTCPLPWQGPPAHSESVHSSLWTLRTILPALARALATVTPPGHWSPAPRPAHWSPAPRPGHGWHGSDSSSSLQDSSPSWLCLQAPSHSHDGPSWPGSAHVSAWLPLPLPPTSPWGPSSTQGSLSHWPIREHLLPGEPLSPVLEPGRSHHPKILTQFSPPQEGLTPGGQTQGPPAASSCGRALAPRPGAGSVDAGLWVDP